MMSKTSNQLQARATLFLGKSLLQLNILGNGKFCWSDRELNPTPSPPVVHSIVRRSSQKGSSKHITKIMAFNLSVVGDIYGFRLFVMSADFYTLRTKHFSGKIND